MQKKRPKILALNPGSRYLGFAVFSGPELRDWGIKTIKRGSSREKIETAGTILQVLIEQYAVNILAVKKLHSSRSSAVLKTMVDEIIKLARRNDLKAFQYSLSALASLFSPNQRLTKAMIAEFISRAYPFLVHEMEKEKANRNPYHIRVFEAIALGLVALNRCR